MNRSKIKIAAAVCALSLLTVSAPLSAGAAEWINLSSWAYAEVSGFVSDGLLPETLSGVSDYTRPIKRWELGELVYSILYNTGRFADDAYQGREFADCAEYPNINKLYRYGIVEGDGNGNFSPERNITREDAAVLIERAMEMCGMYRTAYNAEGMFIDIPVNGISDADQISDHARYAVANIVNDGIMTNMGDGSFEPKGELSVEQAVVIAYRFYELLPRLIRPDNDGLDSAEEQVIQSYENGVEEIWDGNGYILRKDGEELMTFESDVYSTLLCCDYNGETLVFAVNFNDKTDVFRAETGEFLYTIPYIAYKLRPDEGYVYVYSSRFMPAYSGIYGFDGNEITAPEYSEVELSELAANGFTVPQEEYRAADGWIYYSNWNDNGHLYKVDSNGENKKLLVDGLDCYNTDYIDGMLYFQANEDNCLYCTDTDGSRLYKVSEKAGTFIWVGQHGFNDRVYDETDIGTSISGHRTLDAVMSFGVGNIEMTGGWKLYGEDAHVEMEYTNTVTGEKTPIKIGAYTLKMFRINGGEAEYKTVADFPVANVISSFSDDDRILFTSCEEEQKTGSSPIYMYDGNELTCVSGELRAVTYGFMIKDETDFYDPFYNNKVGFITPEELGGGTYHVVDLDTGEITQEKLRDAGETADGTAETSDEPARYDDLSGGGYDIFRGDDLSLYVRTETETRELGKGAAISRDGDTLYYTPAEFDDMGVAYIGALNRSGLGGRLIAYDLRTGEQKLISDSYMYPTGSSAGVMSILESTGQYRRIVNGEALTAYPNKGLHRYGEVGFIMHMNRNIWQPRYLYKLDTDGNFTQLTDCHTEYWLYVPNGADEKLFSQYG